MPKLEDVIDGVAIVTIFTAPIAFIVSWIILVVVAVRLSIAKRKAERSQALCGSEYMEIESDRHAIKVAYEKNITLLFPAMILLSLTSLLLMCVVCFGFYKDSDDKLTKPQLCILVLGAIMTASFISLWISEIVALSKLKRQVKMQTTISASWIKRLTHFTISSSSLFIGLIIIIIGAILSNLAKKNNLALYIIFLVFAIILVISKILIGIEVKSLTNKAIVPYSNTANDLNTRLANMLRKPQSRFQTQTYLSNNIHRMHPDLDIDPILNPDSNDPYRRKYYLYVEHRGGKETIQGLENTKRMTLRTLKGLLAKYYTYAYPNGVNTSADELGKLPEVVVFVPKGTFLFRNNDIARAIREWIYESIMGTRNQEDVKLSKRAFIGVNEAYTPQASTDNFGTVLLNKLNPTDGDVNVDYLKKNINKVNGSVVWPENKLQDLVSSALLLDSVDSADLRYDDVDVDINDLLFKLSMVTIIPATVKNAITEDIVNFQESNAMSALQSKMRELRNMSPVMKSEANKLIRHVFWTSLVILFIVGFIVFHMIYKQMKTKNSSGMLVMMIALVTLLLIVVGAMYQWIMGVTQL